MDFHDPKLASAPPEAADERITKAGERLVAPPEENPQLPSDGKVVEKKND